MKDKSKFFPIIFLISGIIIILTVSVLSVKKYIKQNGNRSVLEDNISNEKLKKDSKEKLFFQKPKEIPDKISITIYKGKKIMELYGDNQLMGRFKIGLGRAPEGKKEKEGDNKTPEGSYYVCYVNSQTKYKYFLGLSYPNIDDAQKALNESIINKSTYEKIKAAIENKKQPPWNTPLGGAIGIHGGGAEYNWTYGCIALSDSDIDILKQYASIKTPVKIYK
ncbi:murein L,D-transpeptidase family protein [Clostridium sp. WILCCON 0269]|uniref:Murein L,D-transpeptidase family protein n=1 Tax=Candidatus Clostridium eludens TaxID=3381663 RepID=A0ABW8SKT0_9CLOT